MKYQFKVHAYTIYGTYDTYLISTPTNVESLVRYWVEKNIPTIKTINLIEKV
jgi:hypothetical protein